MSLASPGDVQAEGDPARAPASRRHKLPQRDPAFRGRTSELADLHGALNRHTGAGVTQRVGTWGQGGIGKTALAIEYAWRHLDHYPGGAFWVSAAASALAPGLASLAPALAIPDSPNTVETATRVRDKLSTGAPALLILDNVPDSAWLLSHAGELPGQACRLLITTRAPELPGVELLSLDRLNSDDARELLTTQRSDASEPEQRAAVNDIISACEGLAIALVVAGAYLKLRPEVTWSAYARSLAERGPDALEAAARDAEDLFDTPPAITLVFSDLTFALSPAARRALEFTALLPPDAVPDNWLEELLTGDGVPLPDYPGHDAHPARAVLEDLQRRHLLRRARENEPLLTLHRLFASFLCARLEAAPDELATLLDGICAFALARVEVVNDAVLRPDLRIELTPFVALVELLDNLGRRSIAARLANRLHVLRRLARFDDCRAQLERFATASGHTLGAEYDEEGAALLSNLATLHQDLGQLAPARDRLLQAIAIQEKQIPPDDRAYAAACSNLGALHYELGELASARVRLLEAIAIQEKYLPADDPALADSYSNLAMALKELGEVVPARDHLLRAIAIQEKQLAPDHPSLAISYSNLATVLQELGEFAPARDRLLQAIAIQAKHFLPDHQIFATSYSNLAVVLQGLGELTSACNHLLRAIAIQEKHFSPDHPELARSYHNLASVVLALGDREQACALWHRARQILKLHFPDTDHRVRVVDAFLERYCRKE